MMKIINSKSLLLEVSAFSTGGFIAKYNDRGHMEGNCTGQVIKITGVNNIKKYLKSKGYEYKGNILNHKK